MRVFCSTILIVSSAVLSACTGEQQNVTQLDEITSQLELSAIVASCSGCHADTSKAIPSIDALSIKDLANRLKAYQTEDGSTVMHRIGRGYTDEEIEQIAQILGSAGE